MLALALAVVAVVVGFILWAKWPEIKLWFMKITGQLVCYRKNGVEVCCPNPPCELPIEKWERTRHDTVLVPLSVS